MERYFIYSGLIFALTTITFFVYFKENIIVLWSYMCAASVSAMGLDWLARFYLFLSNEYHNGVYIIDIISHIIGAIYYYPFLYSSGLTYRNINFTTLGIGCLFFDTIISIYIFILVVKEFREKNEEETPLI